MNTKTFKIGEYAKGGVITAEVHKNTIKIIGKEWDYSQGSSRNSNQSNAKEFTSLEVGKNDANCYGKLNNFLNDLTTSYYSDVILEWINTKTIVKMKMFGNW